MRAPALAHAIVYRDGIAIGIAIELNSLLTLTKMLTRPQSLLYSYTKSQEKEKHKQVPECIGF